MVNGSESVLFASSSIATDTDQELSGGKDVFTRGSFHVSLKKL